MRPSIFILYTLSGLTSFVTKVASTVPTDFATTFQEAQEDTFGFATVAQSVDRPRVVPNSYIAEFVRPETTDDKGIEVRVEQILECLGLQADPLKLSRTILNRAAYPFLCAFVIRVSLR